MTEGLTLVAAQPFRSHLRFTQMAQVQVFCQVHLSFTQMVFLAGAHTNGHLCVLRDPAPPATLDRRWFALQLEMGKSVRDWI